MNFIKLIGIIIALLILLCWLTGIVWLICLAMVLGNIVAIILTIVLILLLVINVILYYKEKTSNE